MIQLLYLLILFWGQVHHHDLGNAEKATTPTACYCAAPALVASHGLHLFEQQAYRALHSGSFITSFSRFPSPCAAQNYPSRQSQSNGGVMEMPKVLEDFEWQTCTLPSLRRPLGPLSGYQLHPTGKTYRCTMDSKPRRCAMEPKQAEVHRMGEMCNGKAMQPPNKGLAHPEPEVAQNNRGDAGHVARRSRKAVYRNMLRHPCHLRGVHPPTSQRMCRRTTMG